MRSEILATHGTMSFQHGHRELNCITCSWKLRWTCGRILSEENERRGRGDALDETLVLERLELLPRLLVRRLSGLVKIVRPVNEVD